MPTTRPRHQITETPDVAKALDAAARRWPEERSRARLLVRLVEQGHRLIAAEQGEARAEQRAALDDVAGLLDGVYSDGYLADLREEWPP